MKKMSLFLSTILAVLLIFVTTSSQAITIDFNPLSQSVLVGSPANVALEISGLEDVSVSTFDIDIGFDPVILTLSAVTFGSQLDLFGLGSIQSFTPGLGRLNLFELSLDLPDELNSLQEDSFVLAYLSFDTLAAGTSLLNLSINALGDALGDSLSAQVQSGSIGTAVPEPATLVLVTSGIIGLGLFGRRKLFRKTEVN